MRTLNESEKNKLKFLAEKGFIKRIYGTWSGKTTYAPVG